MYKYDIHGSVPSCFVCWMCFNVISYATLDYVLKFVETYDKYIIVYIISVISVVVCFAFIY